MKKYETICEGDVIMPIGTKFLAKAIQFFQRIYKKRENIKTKLTPNHADRVCIFEGRLSVRGMVPNPEKKGLMAILKTRLYTRPFSSEYGEHKNYIVLTPRIPYTIAENEKSEDFALSLIARDVHYGFWDFFWQTWYSFTGQWKGKKGKAAENELICTEYVAEDENVRRPNSFPEPWHVNPVEIMEFPGYIMKNIDYEYYKNLYIKYKEEHHEKIF